MTDPNFRPHIDELLVNNARYVDEFADDHIDVRPRLNIAIVACMDSRMNIFEMLGLQIGRAHV